MKILTFFLSALMILFQLPTSTFASTVNGDNNNIKSVISSYFSKYNDILKTGNLNKVLELNSFYAKFQAEDIKTFDKANTIEESITPFVVPGDYTVTYNRNDAVYYANLYTDNSGGHAGTSYNNGSFKYFSYQNYCQNYVSQAVWYGFAGRSSANRDIPMESSWFANTTTTSTTCNWTCYPSIRYEIR